jgi:hypothetical protein
MPWHAHHIQIFKQMEAAVTLHSPYELTCSHVTAKVVADGAARAPYSADATQAAAGGPDSHGAALRHCIPLLGELEGGAARSPLHDLAGPITGDFVDAMGIWCCRRGVGHVQ